MVITYTDEKKFTKEQTQRLFLSVGWVSGQYPERLHKALMGSSTVFSAWDGFHIMEDGVAMQICNPGERH